MFEWKACLYYDFVAYVPNWTNALLFCISALNLKTNALVIEVFAALLSIKF